ncbi:MAG: hypothetical protein ACD_42C00077G0007 [uncultured bacterium]|nr:MAG: hypothetical protein ACD_42C00077G0007 [uncultured bacterium]
MALRAIESVKWPYADIDLFMKQDSESVMNEFFDGIGTLISKIIKPTEQAIRKLESLLKNLSVSIRVGQLGFEFTVSPKTVDAKKNLKSLLIGVDELLVKHKKHAIIFIDEIQSISGSPVCDEVESSLRFVAQKTKNISFIFSGSNRHLLSQMFEDRSRPLYKLCHKIPLQRISAEHYKNFINKFSRVRWKENLSNETLEEIFSCAKCHPYYMNILCSYLFESNTIPRVDDVVICWKKICREEQGSVARDIEFLTSKQKQLLSEIAKAPGLKEPAGKNFSSRVNLSVKGILGAIEILLKHDLVEKLETGEIRIVDPVLDCWSK